MDELGQRLIEARETARSKRERAEECERTARQLRREADEIERGEVNERKMRIAKHRFDNDKRRRGEHHPNQRQLTPPYVLEPIRALLGGIGLDPCTEPDNPTAAGRFYTPPQDGCALAWDASSVFCNPPYGEARNRWVERCIDEGKHRPVVLLIPSHTETQTFQMALRACQSVVFVQARLQFGLVRANGRQEAASHGSAIFGFGVNVAPLDNIGAAMCACEARPTKCPTCDGVGAHNWNCTLN